MFSVNGHNWIPLGCTFKYDNIKQTIGVCATINVSPIDLSKIIWHPFISFPWWDDETEQSLMMHLTVPPPLQFPFNINVHLIKIHTPNFG